MMEVDLGDIGSEWEVHSSVIGAVVRWQHL